MLPKEKDITSELLAALGEGVYGVNSQGMCTFINPSALAMLGYTTEEVLGKDQHQLFHHHKPNGAHYPHHECPIYQCLRDGKRRQCDELFITKEGHHLPIRLTVTALQSEAIITGAVVAFTDVSELIETQAAMRSERDLFAEGPVSVLVWALSEHWPIRYASENVKHLFGYCSTAMLSPDFHYASCIHPDDLQRVTNEVAVFVAENKQRWEQHYRIIHPDGEIRHLHDYTIVERDTAGNIVQLHGYLIDETRQKMLEQALTEMATTDALTGLSNRRHLMTGLEAECVRFRRMGTAISVLMLDLDYFKQINDTWGHAAGDAVLQHFADIVKRLARKTDHVGRIGGEEFVIVLPETDEQGACVFAEKVRCAVLDAPLLWGELSINYTVSIGVACCSCRQAEDADSILQKADQALYQAKTLGRNRVISIDVCNIAQTVSSS